jgi:thiol:disulfide interchange protein DsbC
MRHLFTTLLVVLLPIAGCSGGDDDAAALQASLELLDVAAPADDLAEAPIEGFYEIVSGTQVLYLSHDGETLIDGDIVSMSQETNLTERRRARIRADLVATIGRADRIEAAAAAPERARITVFVDTNCPYCSRLHRNGDELAARGIVVDYVFYPRGGPDSASFADAVSVWCADAPLEALGRALGDGVTESRVCPNPVQRQYEIARALELRGTPAIVLPDGAVLYGARDVDEIVAAVVPEEGK